MDPILKINPKKDTSLVMLLAAQAREYDLYFFEPHTCYVINDQVRANGHQITVFDDLHHWVDLQHEESYCLNDFDVVLVRKDPPFNMEYIYLTYMLDILKQKNIKIVNDPQGLRNANEKCFITRFPNCIPKTLISANMKQLHAFCESEKDIIVKPLDGMGGKEIFRIKHDDVNRYALIEAMTQQNQRTIMAQKFIPEVSDGDKRILLIKGEPIPYSYKRMPGLDKTRANLAAGGHGEGQPLTKRDLWICQQLKDTLIQQGLIFTGIDVIGDYLTEINVTSPTCARELNTAFNLDIGGKFLDAI